MTIIRKTGLSLALCLAAGAASAQEVTLRMANWLPPSHHIQQTLARWIESVSEATDDEVKIDLMPTPLAPPPGTYDLVKNGIVDIGYSIAALTPNKFQKFRAIEMPFLLTDAASGSAGLMQWYTDHGFAEEEFEGTHLIAAFTHAPFLVHATQPVEKVSDLEGLKIRAGGTGIDIFRALGAAPVFLAPGDTTEALQRGTVDATQFTWESLEGFRLTDIATHSLEFPDGGLYGTAFWVAMNERSWNRLSEKQQQALTEMGVSGSRLIGEGWDAAEEKGRQAAVDNGNSIVTLGAEDTAALREQIGFVREQWIEQNGPEAAQLLDSLEATIAAQ